MDTERYKSVAVPIDVWQLAQAQAKKNERSVARQIAWLLRKENEKADNSGATPAENS